jgi:hypothetical protein
MCDNKFKHEKLSPMQKTANAIELATTILLIAQNNMSKMSEHDRDSLQDLMNESLVEFIVYD